MEEVNKDSIKANEQGYELAFQKIISENPAFGKKYFSEQAMLLARYNMAEYAKELSTYANSLLRLDLARISVILMNSTSFAKSHLANNGSINLRSVVVALIKEAFQERFPDAGLFLEKSGQLKAEQDRYEMQNAFLEKMVQLTEQNEKLKVALTEANLKGELKKAEEANRQLEKALAEKESQLKEATQKLNDAEINTQEEQNRLKNTIQELEAALKSKEDKIAETNKSIEAAEAKAKKLEEASKAKDQEKQESQEKGAIKINVFEEWCKKLLDMVIEQGEEIKKRTETGFSDISKEINNSGFMIQQAVDSRIGRMKDGENDEAIMEKLKKLDEISSEISSLPVEKIGKQIREELAEIKKSIKDAMTDQPQKGFFGRRRKAVSEQSPETQEPDPEQMVISVMKDASYSEEQLSVILNAVEQGEKQGIHLAELSKLADPEIPVGKMDKLARFIFARRGLKYNYESFTVKEEDGGNDK